MKRVRVYNEKGAKFTTTSDLAIHSKLILVEVVELLHRAKIWERKFNMSHEMQASQEYYKNKWDFCLERLEHLRKEGYNVPRSVEDLHENILN